MIPRLLSLLSRSGLTRVFDAIADTTESLHARIADLEDQVERLEAKRDRLLSDAMMHAEHADAQIAKLEAENAKLRAALEDEYVSQCEGGKWSCLGCLPKQWPEYHEITVFDSREAVVHIATCPLHRGGEA